MSEYMPQEGTRISYALILVLFILLAIIGCVCSGYSTTSSYCGTGYC